MDSFLEKISFPNILNLTLSEVNMSLSILLQSQSLTIEQKRDVRKLMAVLRNLLRNEPRPPLIMVISAIGNFPFGKPISEKLVFYTSQKEFYRPISEGVSYNKIEETEAKNCFDEKSRFSQTIVEIAKRKGIRLPNTNS